MPMELEVLAFQGRIGFGFYTIAELAGFVQHRACVSVAMLAEPQTCEDFERTRDAVQIAIALSDFEGFAQVILGFL